MRLSISDAYTGTLNANRTTAANIKDIEYTAFMARSPFFAVSVGL